MFDFITNISSCYVEIPAILYFSHIVPMGLVLVMCGFLLRKDYKNISIVFFTVLSLSFSLWSLFDLITWLGHDSRIINISWILVYLFESLIFISAFYFCRFFISKKSSYSIGDLFVFILLTPFLLLLPTNYSIEYFDNPNCEGSQGILIYYLYLIEAIFSALIFFILSREYLRFSKDKRERKKVILFSLGILFYLLSFFWTSIIGNLTTDYSITQYGLFGMPVFLGFLSYLILKYQAFNVKVIATQYFIVVIWVLVSSQFFISQERSAYIPITASWLIVTLAGFWLFRIMGQEEETAKKLSAASARLSRINEKLKEISRAKSEFISIASHQLRTPLTSIKGYTSLILEKTFGTVPRKQEEALEKVLINNEKLVLLVEDMLNVSRLEAGRLEYDFEKQPILPIVEDAISNLKLYAKNKGLSIKLIKVRNAKDFKVIADSRKIFEILSNLIDNAIKYTVKGGLTVNIGKIKHSQKIGRSDEAGVKTADWVKISVTDTGIGIEKKNLESIFEKYKQGGSLVGENTPASTGLGIYIGRQMAKAHGGKLYAKSEGKNKGSTFVLCLPLAQENGNSSEHKSL